jgi:RES domain-containing protein
LEIPDEKVKIIEKEKLPENWFHYPAPRILAEIAEEYYRNQEILGIKVPSAVIHQQYNILINSRSKHFHKIKVNSVEPFVFDPRLYKKV